MSTTIVRGDQTPRICSVPESVSSAGEEAVDLARSAGLDLDPWQEFILASSLGERKDGKWAAFQVGATVPRQNGKGGVLEARELAGLYLLGEPLVTHSAHQFDTSLEAFRRLLLLIENTPEFSRRVKRVSRSHGEEGIELNKGQRIRFRTRTRGGGRGFTGDCLILDEAMIIPESAHRALFPTLSARPNPQVWYTGSAVDQWEHEHGLVFAKLRARGMAGDPRVAYFEWSVDADNPEEIAPETAEDLEAWAQANPALGIRISEEYIRDEQAALSARGFAVERLGVGDWPDPEEESPHVIPAEKWTAAVDEDSKPQDPVAFAFDVTPDRSRSSIDVAGRREDGNWHVEVVEHHRGTGWVVERLVELNEQHSPSAIVCDAAGPAASLVKQLEQRGIEVTVVTAKEHAQACGNFYDACDQGTLRHLDTPELTEAVRGAVRRTLGDAWAWSRKSSGVDISPLVAGTLALWAAQDGENESVYQERDLLVLS